MYQIYTESGTPIAAYKNRESAIKVMENCFPDFETEIKEDRLYLYGTSVLFLLEIS